MPDSLAVDPTLQAGLTIRPADDSTPGDTLASRGLPMQSLPALSVDLRDALTGDAVASQVRPDLEVRGVIGEGGMGRVLLARQHSLARDVAVKTAKRDAPQSSRDAILVEGTITGQLEHPAIVPVHALGLDPSGWPARVMKRVEGVASRHGLPFLPLRTAGHQAADRERVRQAQREHEFRTDVRPKAPARPRSGTSTGTGATRSSPSRRPARCACSTTKAGRS